LPAEIDPKQGIDRKLKNHIPKGKQKLPYDYCLPALRSQVLLLVSPDCRTRVFSYFL